MNHNLRKTASYLLIIATLSTPCVPLYAWKDEYLEESGAEYEPCGTSRKPLYGKSTDFEERGQQNEFSALGQIVFGVASFVYKGMKFAVNNPGKAITMGLMAQAGIAATMSAFPAAPEEGLSGTTDSANHEKILQQQRVVENSHHYRKRATLGNEFQVNQVETGDQKWPSSLILPNENIFTTWKDQNVDIYGRIFFSNGTAITSEFKINQSPAIGQNSASVVSLCNENIFVAWPSSLTGGDIYGTILSLNGTAVTTEFIINQNTTGSQYYPSGISLLSKNMFMAWRGDQTGNSSIYGRIISPNGTALTDEFIIHQGESSVTFIYDTPPLTVFPNGNVFIVWRGEQTGDDDIYGRLYSPNGTALTNAFIINQNTTGSQSHPSVKSLTNGNGLVAWDGDQTGNKNSYGRIFFSNGTALTDEFRINQNVTGYQTYPTITAMDNGNVFLAWQGDQTGDYNIYGRIFSSYGIPLTDDFTINQNTTGNQNSAFAISLINDGVFIVWKGYQSGITNIYARILTADYLNSSIPMPPIALPPPLPKTITPSVSPTAPVVTQETPQSGIPTGTYLGGGFAALGAIVLCAGGTWCIVNHKKKRKEKEKKVNKVSMAEMSHENTPQNIEIIYSQLPDSNRTGNYDSVPPLKREDKGYVFMKHPIGQEPPR